MLNANNTWLMAIALLGIIAYDMAANIDFPKFTPSNALCGYFEGYAMLIVMSTSSILPSNSL